MGRSGRPDVSFPILIDCLQVRFTSKPTSKSSKGIWLNRSEFETSFKSKTPLCFRTIFRYYYYQRHTDLEGKTIKRVGVPTHVN